MLGNATIAIQYDDFEKKAHSTFQWLKDYQAAAGSVGDEPHVTEILSLIRAICARTCDTTDSTSSRPSSGSRDEHLAQAVLC
jgi:hypothetical protein